MIKYGVNVNGQIKDIKVLAVKFINDKYEVMPELIEIQEPSKEEQERAIEQHEVGNAIYFAVMDVLERVCKDRDLDFEKTKEDLMETIIASIATKFSDLVVAKSNGSLTDEINNIINNAIINKQMADSVKQVEVEAERGIQETAVSKIDEIVPTQFGPSSSTYRTDLLNANEINAFINPGLSFVEQQRADQIIMGGPGDEPEIEAGDGVEETEVFLNKEDENKKISM